MVIRYCGMVGGFGMAGSNDRPDLLVALIGQQRVPNIIPIRYFRPQRVLMFHSEYTEQVSSLLKEVLEHGDSLRRDDVITKEIDPYNIVEARKMMLKQLNECGWESSATVFNITGGTKPMAMAAYDIARVSRAKVAYLNSESPDMELYSYVFGQNADIRLEESNVVPSLISIGDYLDIHLGPTQYKAEGFAKTPGGVFEEAVYEAIRESVDEVVAGISIKNVVELDLVIRCGNRVGIAELKTGSGSTKKDPVEQLVTATERDLLGRYTSRFLIIDRCLLTRELRDLAAERQIELIELPSFEKTRCISEDDKNLLRQKILNRLS